MDIPREHLIAAIEDMVRTVFGRYLHRGHRPADIDMTLGQIECLRLIERLGSPSMSQLVDRLQLSPSSVTGLIEALVGRGLVQRVPDERDRRVVRAELTESGHQEREKQREHVSGRLRTLLGDLPDRDIVRLHLALSLLHLAAMERSRQDEDEDEEDGLPAESADPGGTK